MEIPVNKQGRTQDGDNAGAPPPAQLCPDRRGRARAGPRLGMRLEELGCRPVGPASTVDWVEKLIAYERPNFALLEGHVLTKDLQALADCLEHHEVPFRRPGHRRRDRRG